MIKMKKSLLIKNLEEMPEEFSADELIERILILQKIEEGQEQIKQGKTFTNEEVKSKLEKWLK